MSEMWNVDKQAYADCEGCKGKGWFDNGAVIVEPCPVCLQRRIADLEVQLEVGDKHHEQVAIGHVKLRAGLFAQLEWQTNRALKWRRQAAYYKLREKRCMGEANYTGGERVDDLERQRDDLAAALRKIQSDAPVNNVGTDNYWKQMADKMGDIAARALARLEGNERE